MANVNNLLLRTQGQTFKGVTCCLPPEVKGAPADGDENLIDMSFGDESGTVVPTVESGLCSTAEQLPFPHSLQLRNLHESGLSF